MWRKLTKQFEFSAEHELVLLKMACRQLDLIEQSRGIVAETPYVQGRFGLKPHPAMAVERGAVIVFSRLIRQLGLHDEIEEALTERRPGNVRVM